MKKVGFPISQKDNEKRRCLIPFDLINVKYKDYLYIEKGYGEVLGFSDQDYIDCGVNVVSQEEVLDMDIICDGKIGDAAYLSKLKNQTIYGWVHAVQNKEITDLLLNNGLTVYAWEDMFEEGRHVFWRNNEIAGEAAIMHAYTLHGIFPYDTKVAVIGRGNIARGALRVLTLLGAEVMVYDRKTEALFRKELSTFDVIVNCVLWDTTRKDHIIYRKDLQEMKDGSLIIDVSCDRNGGVETCVPTSMTDPIYTIDGVTHYAVDHTPSIFYKTISKSLSEQVTKTIDMLISGQTNKVLDEALIIDKGKIIDLRIIDFQSR